MLGQRYIRFDVKQQHTIEKKSGNILLLLLFVICLGYKFYIEVSRANATGVATIFICPETTRVLQNAKKNNDNNNK